MLRTLLITILCVFISNSWAKEKAIFGEDNVFDYFELSNPFYDNLSNMTVVLVDNNRLKNDGDAKRFVSTSGSLRSERNLCRDERFADQKQQGFCSGFFISDDLVVTAGHCIKDNDHCKNISFVQGYKTKAETQKPVTLFGSRQVYTCKRLLSRKFTSFGSDYEDYAVVLVDRSAKDLKLQHKPIVTDYTDYSKELTVIGHPLGIPQKIARNGFAEGKYNSYVMATDLDTFGGNSGSPVFDDKTGNLYGILVAGGKEGNLEYDEDAKCNRWVRCESTAPNARCNSNLVHLLSEVPAVKDGLVNSFRIFEAAEVRDRDRVLKLMEQKFDHTALSRNEYNFLQYAIWLQDMNLVKKFIDLGNNINHRDIWGRNAFLFAAVSGWVDGAKFLLEKRAPINTVNINGSTALHIAARRGHANFVKFLIEQGANQNIKNKEGKLPLDLAIEKKKASVIVTLLKDKVSNYRKFKIDDKYLVQWVFENGSLKDAMTLFEKGFIFNFKTHNDISKFMVEVVKAGNVDLFGRFLSIMNSNYDEPPVSMDEPIKHAYDSDNWEMIKLLYDKNFIFKSLKKLIFKRKVQVRDIEFVAKTKHTYRNKDLIFEAFRNSEREVIDHLYENAERLNFKYNSAYNFYEGYLAYAMMGYRNNADIDRLRMIIEKAAIVEVNDQFDSAQYPEFKGFTALHFAVSMESLGGMSAAAAIMKRCPNFDLEDAQGRDPYKLARKLGYKKRYKGMFKAGKKACEK
ncbi:MAG: trypsin-like serine protease [Oligoflexia bacterium]|nr:trypsin-like serine protease [Oligoflexia bacterium]